MPRWKELPDSLDPRVRHLVVHLRRLKDHTELSLAALAAKTPYSRSSWERYLNGAALPPQRAVEELARLGGGDLTRLRALHEVAASAWASQAGQKSPADERKGPSAGESSQLPNDPVVRAVEGPGGADDREDGREEAGLAEAGAAAHPGGERAPADTVGGQRTAADDAAPAEPGGPPRPRWRTRRVLLIGAAAVAVAGVAGGVLAASPWDSGAETERNPLITAHDEAFPEHPDGTTYGCDIQRDSGRTYAGHSTTRSAILELNSIGWHVVEAQCLLRDAGFSPGAVDGIYGDMTVAAVKRAQKDGRIPADGEVGPETWGVLRR